VEDPVAGQDTGVDPGRARVRASESPLPARRGLAGSDFLEKGVTAVNSHRRSALRTAVVPIDELLR